jgi:hypothetical protein
MSTDCHEIHMDIRGGTDQEDPRKPGRSNNPNPLIQGAGPVGVSSQGIVPEGDHPTELCQGPGVLRINGVRGSGACSCLACRESPGFGVWESFKHL